MARLPSVPCPQCDRILKSDEFKPNAQGGARRASGYESCLRRCDDCGIGLSNANTDDLERLTIIHRDPFARLPDWLREGWQETMDQALNVRNRPKKKARFGHSTSEDHVTWTVFRFLQCQGILGKTLRRVGIGPDTEPPREPTMLLWGVPSPIGDPEGTAVRERIEGVLNQIGEYQDFRSEPDLVLDFQQAGLALVEVKYRSGNAKEPRSSSGWNLYLKSTQAFRDPEMVRRSGLYELARYWRIGCDLAGERPFTLVNLGLDDLFTGHAGEEIERFHACLKRRTTRCFKTLAWADLLRRVDVSPSWFQTYLQGRGLYHGEKLP